VSVIDAHSNHVVNTVILNPVQNVGAPFSGREHAQSRAADR
jgi:hypothetical protein